MAERPPAPTIKGMEKLEYNYDNLIKRNPELENVITRTMFEDFDANATRGDTLLEADWIKNDVPNLELLKKHGSIHHIDRIGKNKAVIAIGAGPSFNTNKDLLYDLILENQSMPFDEQPFLIVASNHMFRPLLKDGIIPHFVTLVDPDDKNYSHLCTKIPEFAKQTIIL